MEPWKVSSQSSNYASSKNKGACADSEAPASPSQFAPTLSLTTKVSMDQLNMRVQWVHNLVAAINAAK